MYSEEQVSHIRSIYLIECNDIYNINKKRSINKGEKRQLAFYYCMIAILVGIVSQYVIDVVFKLLNGTNFKDLFKVSYPWQVYYSIVIFSAFIGFLKAYLPPKLLTYAAVLISTIVYQTIARITGQETLTNEELIESIIADIFIVQLIIYVYSRLTSSNNSSNNSVDGVGNIFIATLSSSLVINVSSFLSKNAYSKLFNFRSSNSSVNVVSDDN